MRPPQGPRWPPLDDLPTSSIFLGGRNAPRTDGFRAHCGRIGCIRVLAVTRSCPPDWTPIRRCWLRRFFPCGGFQRSRCVTEVIALVRTGLTALLLGGVHVLVKQILVRSGPTDGRGGRYELSFTVRHVFLERGWPNGAFRQWACGLGGIALVVNGFRR